jgi:hypothetical protein
MAEHQPLTQIDQLRRANRRWRRIALCALSALVLVLGGWAATTGVQLRQARDARVAAEQARQEAEQARQETRRALYASQILLAQKAFADGVEKGQKP